MHIITTNIIIVTQALPPSADAATFEDCLYSISRSKTIVPQDGRAYHIASRYLCAASRHMVILCPFSSHSLIPSHRTFNALYDNHRPAAIFYAHNVTDVSRACRCASDFNIKVSPAAGRQGFTGMAIQDAALVIDVSNLTHVRLQWMLSPCHLIKDTLLNPSTTCILPNRQNRKNSQRMVALLGLVQEIQVE